MITPIEFKEKLYEIIEEVPVKQKSEVAGILCEAAHTCNLDCQASYGTTDEIDCFRANRELDDYKKRYRDLLDELDKEKKVIEELKQHLTNGTKLWTTVMETITSKIKNKQGN